MTAPGAPDLQHVAGGTAVPEPPDVPNRADETSFEQKETVGLSQAQIVRRSAGRMGPNIDYVVNTVEHLRALGVRDARLERLMAALGHGPARPEYIGRPSSHSPVTQRMSA